MISVRVVNFPVKDSDLFALQFSFLRCEYFQLPELLVAEDSECAAEAD